MTIKRSIVILTVLFGIFSHQVWAAIKFGTNVRVDDTKDTPNHQKHPSIAVGPSGTIYTTWDDERNKDPYKPDIYFAKSIDGGLSFSPNIKVNDSDKPSIAHKHSYILVNNKEHIYVLYDDGREAGPYSLYLTKSEDRGKTFTPSVRVNLGESPRNYREYATMAFGPNQEIYIVWWERKTLLSHIYFAKSTDDGKTFGPSILIDNLGSLSNEQSYPQIAVGKDGAIYVTAKETPPEKLSPSTIHLVKSIDGGKTFLYLNQIKHPLNYYSGSSSRLLLGPKDEIYVIVEWNIKAIYFSKSLDKGLTFSPPLQISDPNLQATDRYYPIAAVDAKGNINVIWEDKRTGNFGIYFTQSIDGGNTFSPNLRLDDAGNSKTDRYYPAMAVDQEGAVYVTWDDERRGDWDIYFAKGIDPTAEVKPDLTITQFFASYPAQGGIDANEFKAKEGDKIALAVTFFNKGEGIAKENKLGFYIDGKLWPALTLNTPALNKRQIKTYVTTVPWVATPGSHQIKAVIDMNNEVIESFENNNEATRVIHVARDVTPPRIVDISPKGRLPLPVPAVIMKVVTDEDSVCKYDIKNVSYTSMRFTFDKTGERTHTQLTRVPSGIFFKTYYVRCADKAQIPNITPQSSLIKICNPQSKC